FQQAARRRFQSRSSGKRQSSVAAPDEPHARAAATSPLPPPEPPLPASGTPPSLPPRPMSHTPGSGWKVAHGTLRDYSAVPLALRVTPDTVPPSTVITLYSKVDWSA